MDQATQATTPQTSEQTAQRAAYKRASAAAARIVNRLTVLPRDVEARGELGGTYGLRLHFGAGITAGRGVLEVAAITDAEVSRDASASGMGVWIECQTQVDGIPLIARALLAQENADQLLQDIPAPAVTVPEATPPTPTAPTAQPVPLGASVPAHVAVVTPVTAIGGDA